ncbi:hypothetical protein WJX82_006699 [Trebouxia sp. C0006]
MQEPELCCQPGFVAVHVGAGYHSHKHENTYLKALLSACRAAAAASSCMSGVQQAVQALEENEHTNAGIGSNLTLNGTVEADASIMLGDRTFAAIGATPGLGSAIAAAALLAKESQQPLSLGRVRPMSACSWQELRLMHGRVQRASQQLHQLKLLPSGTSHPEPLSNGENTRP